MTRNLKRRTRRGIAAWLAPLLLRTLALAAAPEALGAQAARARALVLLGGTPAIGTEWEDRARLGELLGGDSSSVAIVRSLSSQLAPRLERPAAFVPLAPDLLLISNSDIPYSQNDGPLWAGRGSSAMLRAGAAGRVGIVRVVFAPEILYAQNDAFPDVDEGQWWRPPLDARRSPWSSPWNVYPYSADLFFRPGPEPQRRATLGQSAVWVEGRGVAAGISTENQWWGPGVRDALLFTNNAEGFVHAFVRAARPVAFRFGEFDGRWLVGTLRESEFFDRDPDNDVRSLASAVVTFRPRIEPDLTIGVARSVFASAPSSATAFMRWLDVIQPTRRPNARPRSDSTPGGRDQLTTAFARWVFPGAGAEVYGELGRAEWPANLRDLLVDPTHTLGYLLGLQVARPALAGGAVWRAQAELAFLERSNSYRYRQTASWYASRAAPQGYTHRGQSLGASIGPGSSSQWLALDLVSGRWSAGAFAYRWRRNADWNGIQAYPLGTGWCEYDVTLSPGLRGGVGSPRLGFVRAELAFQNRLNYLYQNNSGCPRGSAMKDVRNLSLRLSVASGSFR